MDDPICHEWDAFVATRTDCAYATLAWRTRLRDAGAGTPYYLAAMRGEVLVGILPLFECGLEPTRRLVSLPVVPYGGLYAADESATHALVDRALRLARGRGVREVVLRARCGEQVLDADGCRRAL